MKKNCFLNKNRFVSLGFVEESVSRLSLHDISTETKVLAPLSNAFWKQIFKKANTPRHALLFLFFFFFFFFWCENHF